MAKHAFWPDTLVHPAGRKFQDQKLHARIFEYLSFVFDHDRKLPGGDHRVIAHSAYWLVQGGIGQAFVEGSAFRNYYRTAGKPGDDAC